MNDCFALLEEPRRPWVDLEALKAKFLRLASAMHPDHSHGAADADQQDGRYAEMNAAYQCLRAPKERLAHLLELERGAKPGGIESVPADLMDLFMRVGELCRGADAFLAERAGTQSPLLKVQLFQRGMAWTDQLNALRQTLQARLAQLEQSLQAMNPAWDTAPPMGIADRAAHLPLESLEQIYRTISYLTRWTGQLQERIVQLSF